MKQLMEQWRGFLKEITSVPPELKGAFKQAVLASKFWLQPNTADEIDEVEGVDSILGTPATEALARSLNAAAGELGVDLYFNISSAEEDMALGPDDEYGGYPNNWLTQGQYRGPYEELDGKHVVWLEIRPLKGTYNLDEFDPETFAQIVSTTLNHELVHYAQLKKQAAAKGISDYEALTQMKCDPEQIDWSDIDPDEYRKLCGREPPEQEKGRKTYLTRHIEVDAFAHEAAEHLLDKYSPEEALDAIRKMNPVDIDKYPEISDVVQDYAKVLKDDPKELNKFKKKLYQQIQQQSKKVNMQELFISWRKTCK